MPKCQKCGKTVKYRKKGLCLKCNPRSFFCKTCGETRKAKFFKTKPAVCKACYNERYEVKYKQRKQTGNRFTIRCIGHTGEWDAWTGRFKTEKEALDHFNKYLNNSFYSVCTFGLFYCNHGYQFIKELVVENAD